MDNFGPVDAFSQEDQITDRNRLGQYFDRPFESRVRQLMLPERSFNPAPKAIAARISSVIVHTACTQSLVQETRIAP